MQDDTVKSLISVKEIIFASIICLCMTVMDLTAFPAVLFIDISVSDITPVILTIMINQWIVIVISFIAIRFLCPQLFKQIGFADFKSGLRSFGVIILILIVGSALAFSLGLIGYYNYTPSVEKIIVEGFIYYIGVGLIEELYIRALLLNIIERLAYKTKYSTLIAIIISSVLFGLGHIFGMIGQSALTIVCRIIWTISLGIIFGVIYKKSNNLWLAVITHILVDFCSVAFCFVSPATFTIPTVISIAVLYLAIALFLLWKHYLHKTKKEFSVE
ncbi:MAG: CPBP family intramembrane metalloprotease [Clostridia bacterium]|nr:CPBP family intramembrane metalloprotease [Clostridia bacterium]